MGVVFMFIILVTIPTLLLCQKVEGVCKISGVKLTCCPDYHNVNGTCILCPKGFFGPECNTPCPIGSYGVGCKSTCACKNRETCNAEEGCVVNVEKSCVIDCGTVCNNGSFTNNCRQENPVSNSSGERTDIVPDYSTADASSFRVITHSEETTSQELLTTELNLEDEILFWQYVTVPSLASLLLTVALCSICFLIKHRHKKKKLRNDIENVVDDPAPEASLDVIPQIANLEHAAYGSDYAEVCDVEAAYADSRELSSVYNDLSFYKSEARIQNFKSNNAVYDTERNCIIQNQEAPNECREDSMDNARYSSTNSFVDEATHKNTVKEVCTSTSEEDSSV